MRLSLLLLSMLLLSSAGCGGGTTCLTGLTSSCFCSSGEPGSQTCNAAGSYDACVCVAKKRIFITASVYTGDLGGLAGADAKCQTAASAAAIGGSWKAWLSSDTVDASARIDDVGPWFTVGSGVKIFNNRTNLSTVPLAPLLENELGRELGEFSEHRVWTGTNQGLKVTTGFCDTFAGGLSWTLGRVYDGAYGEAGSTNNRWSFAGTEGCQQPLRLYCLEQ